MTGSTQREVGSPDATALRLIGERSDCSFTTFNGVHGQGYVDSLVCVYF